MLLIKLTLRFTAFSNLLTPTLNSVEAKQRRFLRLSGAISTINYSVEEQICKKKLVIILIMGIHQIPMTKIFCKKRAG